MQFCILQDKFYYNIHYRLLIIHIDNDYFEIDLTLLDYNI